MKGKAIELIRLSPHETMKVIVVRLITGECVFGGQDEDNNLTIHHPSMLNPTPQGMGMVPYTPELTMLIGKTLDKVTFRPEHVMMIEDAVSEVAQAWNKAHGGVITLDNKTLILPP